MNVWMGVLLALATAAREPYNGPNGLDPSALTVLVSSDRPAELDFDNSGKFLDWLYADENVEQRVEAVGYFVRCALGPDQRVRIAPWPEWRGKYGLAPKTVQRVQDAVRTTSRTRGSTIPVNLGLDADEGKWVSSCLVALVNRKGLHQVVSLRGNHPALTKELLDATRWTMGYPEGIFLADLLNFSAPPPVPVDPGASPITPASPKPALANPPGLEMAAYVRRGPPVDQLERSFTIALNGRECTPPVWNSPPNVPLGRTLSWRDTTCAPSDDLCEFRVARRLGYGEPPGPQSHLDPDHAAAEICVKPGEAPEIVTCPAAGSAVPVLRLRPLFVHLPRFIRVADVGEPDTGGAVNASLPGTLDPSQIQPCNPGDCVAPFNQLWAGGTPPCAPPTGTPGLFTGLRDDQTITATLRLLKGAPELPGLKVDPEQKFTALIRYRSKGAARARVGIPSIKNDAVQWTTVEGALRPDPGFQWLQVYPVKPVVEKGKQMSLKVQLQGVKGGKGFPELDVVGFVPDRPWCVVDEPRNDQPFLVICP